MITAKKVDMDKVELPTDAKGVSAVYEFGPKGTKFNKEVQVQFDTDKDEPEAKVYFTKEGDESAFEKLASTSEGKKVSAETKHFSLGFAGIPDGCRGELDAGMDAGTDEPDTGVSDRVRLADARSAAGRRRAQRRGSHCPKIVRHQSRSNRQSRQRQRGRPIKMATAHGSPSRPRARACTSSKWAPHRYGFVTVCESRAARWPGPLRSRCSQRGDDSTDEQLHR